MSILNAWVEPQRALVVADTAWVDQYGNRGHASKLIPLPHAGAIVAGRGAIAFISEIAVALNIACSDFDAILEKTSRAIQEVYRLLRPLPNAEDAIGELQLVVVGWSSTREQMVGAVYQIRDHKIEGWEFSGASVSPHEPSWNLDLDANTPERLFALMREQQRLLLAGHPEGAAGGRYVIAELTRDAIAIRTAHA